MAFGSTGVMSSGRRPSNTGSLSTGAVGKFTVGYGKIRSGSVRNDGSAGIVGSAGSVGGDNVNGGAMPGFGGALYTGGLPKFGFGGLPSVSLGMSLKSFKSFSSGSLGASGRSGSSPTSFGVPISGDVMLIHAG